MAKKPHKTRVNAQFRDAQFRRAKSLILAKMEQRRANDLILRRIEQRNWNDAKPNVDVPENPQEYAHKLLMEHFAEDRNEIRKFGEPKH